jgi:diacylglycerol kinase family enzyme
VRARRVDLLQVGERRICTVVGFGIVADSAIAAGRLKETPGPWRSLARLAGGAIYRATATASLFTRDPLSEPLEIEITTCDGAIERLTAPSPGLFIANGAFLGGGLRLPGVAADDDGICELLLVQDVSRARLVDAFTRLTLGLPISERVLRIVPAQRVRIVTDRASALVGDGDLIAMGREFELCVDRHALTVLA